MPRGGRGKSVTDVAGEALPRKKTRLRRGGRGRQGEAVKKNAGVKGHTFLRKNGSGHECSDDVINRAFRGENCGAEGVLGSKAEESEMDYVEG